MARARSFGRATVAAAALVGALALGGCGAQEVDATSAAGNKPATLRLGYFPNVTHATAIVGVERGIFGTALGSTKLETKTFNAGPAAMEALNSGAIDATYIGPGPATNGYVKSQGKALVIVSGATSGGAALVVKPEITSAAQLKGRKLSTPQLGNTQDIALRHWLKEQGLATDLQGGGDVKIQPQENPQILDTFTQGVIDGAWVPEPFVTRLVAAGGKVLVDEKTLWPSGQFVTTHLIVRKDFYEKNRELVKALVTGQVEANAWVNANAAQAQKIVGDAIGKLSGKPLDPKVISESWKSLEFTNDPVAPSLLEGAKHAQDAGLLKGEVKLDGIYQLQPLNDVLKSKGEPEVKGS